MKKLLYFLLCSAALQQVSAQEYHNARFNFCVYVPDSMQWQPEAGNGDGRAFTLPKSQVDIRVYGSHMPAVFDYSDAEYMKKIQHEKKQTTHVTYEKLKDNTYTVSGYMSNANNKPKTHIYYEVYKIRNGSVVTLAFTYPKQEKKTMDSVIQQMASSFTWGGMEHHKPYKQSHKNRLGNNDGSQSSNSILLIHP